VNQGPGQVLAGLSLIAAVNMGVAIIKALLTGLVISSIGKMRPDLLEDAKK
jgi:cobalt/nickel transport system permease protein